MLNLQHYPSLCCIYTQKFLIVPSVFNQLLASSVPPSILEPFGETVKLFVCQVVLHNLQEILLLQHGEAGSVTVKASSCCVNRKIHHQTCRKLAVFLVVSQSNCPRSSKSLFEMHLMEEK